MKICVTSYGKTLDTQIDPRFGRCANFLIIDTETLICESIENIDSDSKGAAGIKAGQLVAEKNVEALITGNVGPNAFRVLNEAGIKVISGASGIVKDAVEKYKKGEFQPVNEATVNSHFGQSK